MEGKKTKEQTLKDFKDIYFEVSKESSQMRLDKALSQHPDIFTRSQASQLIRKGFVTLIERNEETHVTSSKDKKTLILSKKDQFEDKLKGKKIDYQVLKSSRQTILGETYKVALPLKQDTKLLPFNIPLNIVFEDEDIIVVNKPSGLVVHPAPGHEEDSLVNALIHHKKSLSMGVGNKNRPGIVHRLDKDTSGLLVIAKHMEVHRKLSQQFRAREIKRTYIALVFGKLRFSEGSFFSYIRRHPIKRKKFCSQNFTHLNMPREMVKKNFLNKEKINELENQNLGKWAVTHYKVIAYSSLGISFIECQLETGRTHQIRVHLSHAGHPLLGDSIYGSSKLIQRLSSPGLKEKISSLSCLALHAKKLSLIHPINGESLHFKVKYSLDLLTILEFLGFDKEEVI